MDRDNDSIPQNKLSSTYGGGLNLNLNPNSELYRNSRYASSEHYKHTLEEERAPKNQVLMNNNKSQNSSSFFKLKKQQNLLRDKILSSRLGLQSKSSNDNFSLPYESSRLDKK